MMDPEFLMEDPFEDRKPDDRDDDDDDGDKIKFIYFNTV